MIDELFWMIWMIRFNSAELFCGAVIGFIAAMILGYVLGKETNDD